MAKPCPDFLRRRKMNACNNRLTCFDLVAPASRRRFCFGPAKATTAMWATPGGASPASTKSRKMRLHRADWHLDDVVDLDQLFHQKRLAILHVDHVPVVTRQPVHLIFELLQPQVHFAF